MEEIMKLNLGCGPHAFQGWVNVDLDEHPNVRSVDLRLPLPFQASTFNFAFTEHFFEHITFSEGLNFLKEVKRVLKPGGVLRIVTPDLRFIVRDYQNRKLDRFKGTWEPETPAQYLNEAMRMWGHQYVYDSDDLLLVLARAGFNQIEACEHRKSNRPDLQNLEVRPFNGELIFEAVKL